MLRSKAIENKVIAVVRSSNRPRPIRKVAEEVSGKDDAVSRAIASLIDMGKLQVTADWKLREAR